MHAQRSSSPEAVDSAIVGLLLDSRFDLWSIAEIEREIGNPVIVRDSLNRLRGAGLIHEIDMAFVAATRAARLAAELEQS
jgi:hypothetical protein